MFAHKKATLDAIGIIAMLIASILLVGAWAFLILEYQKIEIDDRKLRTQILTNKILDGNCFSDDFAKIEENKFSQTNLDECIKGLDESSHLRVFLDGHQFYGFGSEEKFISSANLCSRKSTLLCTEIKYPITYIDEERGQELNILTLQIITT